MPRNGEWDKGLVLDLLLLVRAQRFSDVAGCMGDVDGPIEARKRGSWAPQPRNSTQNNPDTYIERWNLIGKQGCEMSQ
jgi:hypothetical protein